MFYKFFKIQTKDGRLVPFRPTKAQKDYHDNKSQKDIILKARQLGFSTFIKMMDLETILTKKDHKCFTCADTVPNAQGIFFKVTTAWEALPLELREIYKQRFLSKGTLYLNETRSQIVVGTSARSGTAQRLHISEFALLPEHQVQEVITGSFPAARHGEIVVESTALGNNHFREMWNDAVAGKNGFKPHFYNWMWAPEYTAKPPTDPSWKQDYLAVAREFDLIPNIQKDFNLTDEQFYWYYITALEQKQYMRQEYPTIPEEAFISVGRAVFNQSKVSRMKTESFIGRYFGHVLVWQVPDPKHKYIIGADTAEGVGGDSSAMVVLDTDTDDIVAIFSSKDIEPHDFAQLIVNVAKKYNNAYIVAERNASGLTTVTKIQDLKYKNQFINRSVDKLDQKFKDELGWRTTSSNRDLMIDEFREAFHEGRIGISSSEIKYQLETFVVKENGRREHDQGKHDDLLFACFLAWQGKKFIGQQAFEFFGNY